MRVGGVAADDCERDLRAWRSSQRLGADLDLLWVKPPSGSDGEQEQSLKGLHQLASVLGVTTGTLIQIGLATVGLSSLVLASAIAFDVVKYAGAAYLIVLGIMRLRSRKTAIVHGDREPRTLRRLYTQGVIVNTLNPKTALFVFALLPQFVDVEAGHVWLQVLVLGLTLCCLGLLSDGAYAFVAGTVADRPPIVPISMMRPLSADARMLAAR